MNVYSLKSKFHEWERITQQQIQQDRQALLKAKYCTRVAAVASVGSNKVALSSE